MNIYNLLMKEKNKTNIAIIGATRGYGYTLLSQIPNIKQIKLEAICSQNVKNCVDVLLEVGYKQEEIEVCKTIADVNNAKKNTVKVVSDYKLVLELKINSVVECTGSLSLGLDLSEKALLKNINVYMVSKETDSVCGEYLSELANSTGSIYSLVNGDQPKNLIDLYEWGKINGLDIICIGKSSEYDLIFNRENNTLRFSNEDSKIYDGSNFENLLKYKDITTLKKRKKIISDLESNSADLCEMNLVSNATGFIPDIPTLHYPIARISELAEIYIPVEEGGILNKNKVVEVFIQVREEDEASFAGGVFIVFKCNNNKVWQTLKEKGHLVNNNLNYGCIYLPYHIMGVESALTILTGDLLKISNINKYTQKSIMIGEAIEDIEEGRTLFVEGHHHSIKSLAPRLIEFEKAKDFVPFYLLNKSKINKIVKKGQCIRFEDVEINEKTALLKYKEINQI